MARHDEFAMYLISDNDDIMARTDLSHPKEFVALPDTSSGVVRIAEQEEACLGVSGFALKVIKINLIGCAYAAKGIAEEGAMVVADGGEEAIVDGCLGDDFVAWAGQGLDDGGDGWHHA